MISVILPALNERERLPVAVDALRRVLSPRDEIIVVDNGSTDGTAEIANELGCRVIRLPRPAKGAAVAAGMLSAKGRWRYMADVDLASPAATLPAMLAWAHATEADVVLGVRPLWRGSLRRTLTSAVYRRLASGGLAQDPQCGFKLFAANAAQYVFSRLQTEGLAFDAEAIRLAYTGGYQVREMPIAWTHDPDSRVSLLRDSAHMMRDLIRLRRSLSRAPR